MAPFNKFNSFVEALAEKVHNLQSDVLKVALTNTAPSASNTVLADITQIAAGNGYTAGGAQATQASSAQTTGTYKLVLNDVTFTASGGSLGTFRYAVLYNDTAINDELIGFWDYGTTLSITNGNSIIEDFDANNGVLTLTRWLARSGKWGASLILAEQPVAQTAVVAAYLLRARARDFKCRHLPISSTRPARERGRATSRS